MRTCFFVFLLSALAHGGQQPAQQRFDARAEVVLVDVSVLDNDGRPVEGLTAADFDLAVNGQARAIQNVQYISTLGARTEAGTTPRERQYTGNDGRSTGRLLLFVVDEIHLRVDGNRGVMNTAGRVLDVLGPGDLVGLARLPSGLGGIEFTTDHLRVRRGLETVRGSLPGRRINQLRLSESWAQQTGDRLTWERVIERECAGATGLGLAACVSALEGEAKATIAETYGRSLQSLRALQQLTARLAALRTPITLVLISEGLFLNRDTSELADFARRAAEARVTIHVVQPGESMFDFDKPEVVGGVFREDDLLGEGLSMLADRTRGAHYKISVTSGAGAFERIRREISGYYLLAFEPVDADRTARDRRIKVEVKRRGVTVRARSTYALADPAAATAAAAPPEQQIKQLLSAPLQAAGLPMRVATYSVTNVQDGKIRVIVAAEIGEPARDEVEWPVGVLVLDKDANFVVNTIAPLKLAPSSPRHESPRLFLNAFTVEPGEYSLRLAAVGDGRSGSVYHTIDARLRPIGDVIRASDLVVVASERPTDTPRPTPSAIIDSEALSATLELTGTDAQRLSRTRVVFEIAASETTPALVHGQTEQATRANGAVRAFGARLKTELLPPGDYVVRAIVTVPDERPALFTHAFRAMPAAPTVTTAATAPRAADPDAPPAPPPPSRIIAPVPRFAVEEVLKPEVVNAFLDALLRQHPVSSTNAAIVEQARRGTFVSTPSNVTAAADDEPTLAFIRGLAALQKKQLAQASAWFQLALKGASDFLGAAFYLGAVHAASGSDPAAVAAWQMSLIGDGGERAYPSLVDALLRTGDAQTALDLIAEAPEAWPDERARHRRVAIAQAMLGQYAPALETVTALLERTPDDADLLFVALQVMYRRYTENTLTAAERARFFQFAATYERIGGAQAALVQSWVTHLSRNPK
jgi:VWFA-related protein